MGNDGQLLANMTHASDEVIASVVDTNPDKKITIQMSNVRPNTKYEVRVKAFNSRGAGPYSPALLVLTLEGSK